MTVEQRLSAIEARLSALEARLDASVVTPGATPPSPAATVSLATAPVAAAPDVTAAADPSQTQAPPPTLPAPGAVPPHTLRWSMSAGTLLGWTGAAALVLAAAYLIRVGITNGWLTPERQIGGAALAGFAMVGGGLALRLQDRPYSSLLGAAGIATLYLTIWGGHLVHGLLGPVTAVAAVVLIAGLSLSLHALFGQGLYVAFALIGSYATPLLLPDVRGDVLDVAIYLTVWNLVYSVYAFWIRRRVVYFVALYASLLIFAILSDPLEWRATVVFQLAQFLLFTTVVVLFSTRIRPLNPAEAWAHFPALLLFYGVEYGLLDEHVPEAAPWAAVGFVLALYAAYRIARTRLHGDELPSLSLINAFGALVLFQAVYVEVVPAEWRPLVALLITGAVVLARRLLPRFAPSLWPYTAAAALIFTAGYGELIVSEEGRTVLEVPLILLYPAVLYAAYFTAGRGARFVWRVLRLGSAHVQLLLGLALLVDRYLGSEGTLERLWLSFAWALAGVAFLAAARLRRDRMLARSSLLIFGLFAFKVLLFDLSDAGPLVRVGCLAVLGVSLYAGGWIYRRVLEPSVSPAATSPPSTV